MLHILCRRHILQIVQMIVSPIAVLVVDLQLWSAWLSQKGSGNHPVYAQTSYHALSPPVVMHHEIARAIQWSGNELE